MTYPEPPMTLARLQSALSNCKAAQERLLDVMYYMNTQDPLWDDICRLEHETYLTYKRLQARIKEETS